MTLEDFRRLDDVEVRADVCIVGAGPVGLAIAAELMTAGIRIVVVESGADGLDPAVEDLSEIENVGLHRAPQAVTRRRGLGGTSALWTGRCGQLDPVDFEQRPWVEGSGWPISRDEITRYVDRAGSHLGLGPDLDTEQAIVELTRRDRIGPLATGNFRPIVYQFSVGGQVTDVRRTLATEGPEDAPAIGALQHAGAPAAIDVGVALRPRLEASDAVRVIQHATVLEVLVDEHATAVGVRLGSLDGRRGSVTAPIVVLAAGGVDNARLLLASRSRFAAGLGNQHDVVGRYLADHPLAEIASYDGFGSTELRRRLGHFWSDIGGRRQTYTFGAGLRSDIQREQGLLNAAVHIVEFGDRVPAVSSLRIAATAARDRDVGVALDAAREVATHPVELVRGLVDRYWWRRPALPVPSRVSLGCVVEQLPDPSSRITLSDRTDAMGAPRARIDWRASDREYETARRTAELLFDDLRRAGITAPTPAEWLLEGADAWRAGIHDMAHPMCATRMAANPRNGVVDADCRVHGVEGVYVAGSSVFTTSGHMNPTLTAVALGIRLADHLRRRVGGAAVAAGPEHGDPDHDLTAPARLRVGVVGVGARMTDPHLPVLRALADEFEVVGCTGRPDGDLGRYEAVVGAPAYRDAAELVEQARPDVIVAAVATDAVDASLGPLIGSGVPLLVETPWCWSLRAGRQALRQVRRTGATVGVAEQFPFHPTTLLMRRVIELGVLGTVTSATNDGKVYDYHGVALLRSLACPDDVPTAVVGESQEHDGAVVVRGEIRHGDGPRLHHTIGVPPGHPLGERPVVVEGTLGRIVDERLVVDDVDGGTFESSVRRVVGDDGELHALEIDTPLGPVRWDNPFVGTGLTDDQLAAAVLWTAFARSVRFGASPAYTAGQGYADAAQLAAIRWSARQGGRPVSPDPDPVVERIRTEVRSRLA